MSDTTKEEMAVEIDRISSLRVGDRFLLAGTWRRVDKIVGGELHYSSKGSKDTTGEKNQQFVQIFRTEKVVLQEDMIGKRCKLTHDTIMKTKPQFRKAAKKRIGVILYKSNNDKYAIQWDGYKWKSYLPERSLEIIN